MRSLARYVTVPVLVALLLVIGVGAIGTQWWLTGTLARESRLIAAVAEARLAAQRLPRWALELPTSPGITTLESTSAGLEADYAKVDTLVTVLQEGGALVASGSQFNVQAESIPLAAQPASAILAEAWSQVQSQLRPLLGAERVERSAASRVSELVGGLDAALLRLSEVLDSEVQAHREAQWLLLIGALVLFAILLGLALWLYKLRLAELETVRLESMEMMAAIPVGLFTLDEDYRLGDQVSPQLMQMFGRGDLADRNLIEVLRDLLPDDTVDTAKEFISLLFSERVNENLIASLNPLDQVELGGEEDRGGRRFLDFAFRRMREDGRVTRLLVTVSDITERVVLTEELDRVRGEGDAQSERLMEVVVGLLKADRKMIEERVQHWRVALKEANQSLKQSARGERDLRQLIDRVFRPVHLVKGEAAAMGLTFILQRAKATELELGLLRDREQLEGNDFLPVAVRLEDIFAQLDVLERMLKQLGKLSVADGKQASEQPVKATPKAQSFVGKLVAGLASKLGRQVRVVLDGKATESLNDDRRREIDDMLGQLARNSLAHGLESAEERTRAGKAPVGEIRYGLNVSESGEIELSFRDDGRGIDLETLRRKAVASRRYSPEQAARMEPRQLMGLIFLPGFSTHGTVTDAAGRGVGLDIVAHTAKRLGGRIGVQSVAGQFTHFRIRLPAPAQPSGAKGE